ncbi:plasmid mobilization relaxosome protein MobC [Sphingobacterium hotanense]|uniref:Plasmid mobilization relaxosome protein MobC n=1 Tax=Sphingobacterium hotanense TaxID=649196 RepID=A0ABT7NU85_9SPHI|nr:plasmid mobilization relaxosome protein MobC [Sphingobacterium hotanense]MDM1050483.1 plasmid mobilization relaxosome protein MobC [Sphingobacterium hotanense]
MKNRKGNLKTVAHKQRTRRFELRLSEAERAQFLDLENALGLSRADIVRIRVLQHSKKMLVNTTEIMKLLDGIGTQIGRSGNNINQLARHANTLQQQGMLHSAIMRDLIPLLTEYVRLQRELEQSIRQLIRLIRGQT